MAKSKSPDKVLMEQLQNERKAFIRVVHSQNKALDEAMKEVEKAKREATKFKTKREKEKEKEKDERLEDAESEEKTFTFPKRNSTPYSYKPPPPYALHLTPSVSQLIYQPPSLERFNSVRKSSKAVTSLALSLEPSSPTSNHGIPIPPFSPKAPRTFKSFNTQKGPTPNLKSEASPEPTNSNSSMNLGEDIDANTSRPAYPGKRVFSDPGPGPSDTTFTEHLDPGKAPRERSRSPYGFFRVPQDEIPKVGRKRPSFLSAPHDSNTTKAKIAISPRLRIEAITWEVCPKRSR